MKHAIRYLADHAHEINRVIANGFYLVLGLAGLASLCTLILMFAGCAGAQLQRHPDRTGVAWVVR